MIYAKSKIKLIIEHFCIEATAWEIKILDISLFY